MWQHGNCTEDWGGGGRDTMVLRTCVGVWMGVCVRVCVCVCECGWMRVCVFVRFGDRCCSFYKQKTPLSSGTRSPCLLLLCICMLNAYRVKGKFFLESDMQKKSLDMGRFLLFLFLMGRSQVVFFYVIDRGGNYFTLGSSSWKIKLRIKRFSLMCQSTKFWPAYTYLLQPNFEAYTANCQL